MRRLWEVGCLQSQMAKLLITKEERNLNRVTTLSLPSVSDNLALCGSKCDTAGCNATSSPDLIERHRLVQVGGQSTRQPSWVFTSVMEERKRWEPCCRLEETEERWQLNAVCGFDWILDQNSHSSRGIIGIIRGIFFSFSVSFKSFKIIGQGGGKTRKI